MSQTRCTVSQRFRREIFAIYAAPTHLPQMFPERPSDSTDRSLPVLATMGRSPMSQFVDDVQIPLGVEPLSREATDRANASEQSSVGELETVPLIGIRDEGQLEESLAICERALHFAEASQPSEVAEPEPEKTPVQDAFTDDADSEISRLSEALVAKFEQLTLIHHLSEQLEISDDPSDVCESLLDELTPCVNAGGLVIDLCADDETNTEAHIYSTGDIFTGSQTAEKLADLCRDTAAHCVNCQQSMQYQGVMICNRNRPNSGPIECSAGTRELRLIVVPIKRHDIMLGRMIAVRSPDEPEFGSAEAVLLKSTSMMLGVHLLNQRQYQQMQAMFEGVIGSLVSALDAKDAYTSGHSTRVSELSVELARRLGFGEEGLARMRMAGILHDIGKIGVDDSVLRKPGRLTAEEFEMIKQHLVLGYEILKGIRAFRPILPAVRHHHESWDGSGYPDGLAGEDIPRDAQVMAVADAFDAMTSDRPYRSGMPLEKVVDIFEKGRGQQWAADVVDILLSCPEVMISYSKRQNSVSS